MLGFLTLLPLTAYVLADRTFELHAFGESIESFVSVENERLVLTDTEPAQFVLEEPSGYLFVDGKNVVLSEKGMFLSKEDRSQAFGIERGMLRAGPGDQKFDFFVCPSGSITNFHCEGGHQIALMVADDFLDIDDTEFDLDDVEMSTEAEINLDENIFSPTHKPSNPANKTQEQPTSPRNSSVIDSKTSISPSHTSGSPSAKTTPSIYQGGATGFQVHTVAGAVAFAIAMLL